jgi:diaminopimelate decarboxylase
VNAWWARPGLEVRDDRLRVAGRDAEALARERGTPLYVYDLVRVEEQARALQDALAGAGLRGRVRLAVKAQRAPEALAVLRNLGPPGDSRSVGIDACSPRELVLALEHGWTPEEISYTGTNVSDRDLDVVLAHPVHVNVDLLSQLERFGRRAPGRAVGLRVNPRAGAGGDGQTYSGEQPTKFGIYEEDLDRAVEVARRHDLTIDTVHFHVGRAFLTDALPGFERAVIAAAAMARRLVEAGMPIREVNVGGGLGVPQRAGDRPLDLDALTAMLARHLGPLDVVVACEPGDFLAKECGHLLAEVVTVEDRGGVTFVGLDAGFAVMPEHFIYGASVEVVLCRAAGEAGAHPVTVAGNINEGDDLFADGVPLPPVEEGDVLAMLNVGSYNAVMAMEHCLRPPAGSLFFTDRA